MGSCAMDMDMDEEGSDLIRGPRDDIVGEEM